MRAALPALLVLAGVGCGSAAGGAPDAPASPQDAGFLPDVMPGEGGDATPPRDAGDAGDAAPEAGDAAPASSCPAGSQLVYARTACNGAPVATPLGLEQSVQAAARGDVVSLAGLDETSAPCFPLQACAPADAPTLLFSDEPESPSSDGILYADVVGPGSFRVYVYHVNAGTGLRKFPVVALNQGTSDVHAVVGPVGLGGPSTDYVAVGKTAAAAWLSSTGTQTVTVPAGARVLLDGDLDGLHAANGELAHAILDIAFDGPVKVSVVSVDASEDATVVTASLPLLANTGQHLRGTFPLAARILVPAAPLDGTSVRTATLGDDVTDLALTGQDGVDGTSVALSGNFGVLYDVRVPLASPAALVVAPRGGVWGAAADISAGQDAPEGVVLLPAAQSSLGTTTDAVFAGRFAAGGSVDVRLLTAGGSNLPVDVVVLP